LLTVHNISRQFKYEVELLDYHHLRTEWRAWRVSHRSLSFRGLCRALGDARYVVASDPAAQRPRGASNFAKKPFSL
jgi:hypothetical protein